MNVHTYKGVKKRVVKHKICKKKAKNFNIK